MFNICPVPSRAPKDGARDQDRGHRDVYRLRDGHDMVQRDVVPQLLLRGSGSNSAAATREVEQQVLAPVPAADVLAPADARGRSPVRQRSPRVGRRRSMEGLNLQPPLSPTSALNAWLCSKRDSTRASLHVLASGCPDLVDFCSPNAMLRPLNTPSPSRPPGFEASPTPPLLCSGPPRRTPSPPRVRQSAAVRKILEELQELFVPAQEPLLPSPPPVRPSARRKTLAGMAICNKGGGISLRRSSARLRADRQAPVAKRAEALVCRSLGIVQNGEDITVQAMDNFAKKFKDRLPDDVIGAMRALFKLDDDRIYAAEAGLIAHGGPNALDHVDEATA